MARVTYGSIITDIAGSIGGITFQANTSSKIARLRMTRRKGNTVSQSNRINSFQVPLQTWDGLSGAIKADWDTFAAAHDLVDKWGATKTLSGFQWFMSINNYLLLVGESVISSPPSYSTPLAVPSVGAVAVPGDFAVTFSPAFAHTSEYLLIYTSPITKTVSQFNRRLLRLTKIVSPGTDSYIDIETDWEDAHGISVPISGSPSGKPILFAVQTVHESKGLASSFGTEIQPYEPS